MIEDPVGYAEDTWKDAEARTITRLLLLGFDLIFSQSEQSPIPH